MKKAGLIMAFSGSLSLFSASAVEVERYSIGARGKPRRSGRG